MKLNNLPLKAVALAVSLAVAPLASAQTDVTVDAAAGTVANPTTAGDVNNSQAVTNGDVTATTGDDIVDGVTAVNGAANVDVDVNSDSLEILAGGNARLIENAGDIEALGATQNIIDIPVGSTDPSQAITSGQLITNDVSATQSTQLDIGADLSGAITGNADVDTNSNSVQTSAQANAVENLISGDLSATAGATGGIGSTATVSATAATASVVGTSDLSISSAQVADGSVTSAAGNASSVIGVELSSTANTTVTGAFSVDASSNSLGADAGGNSAINQFDVEGGGSISRNIANAQVGTVNADIDADVSGFDVGLSATTADSTVGFTSTSEVTANSTTIAADADGNEATNQVISDLNAAASNQSINSGQSQNATVGITADVDDVNVGVNLGNVDITGTRLTVESLSTDVDANADSNIVTNNISLQGIATGTTSDIDNVQNGDSGGSSADISNVSIGIEAAAGSSTPELTLDVSASDVNATAGFNSGVNQVILGGIATSANNDINSTQEADAVNAGVVNVSVGLNTAGVVNDGGASGNNDISVLSTDLGASATGNNVVNNINAADGADSTVNDVVNVQNADAAIAATVNASSVGAVFTGAGTNTADVNLSVNSTSVNASGIGSLADNDITLVGTGVSSNNDILTTQTTTGNVDASATNLNIGLESNSGAGNTTSFSGNVRPEVLSNSINVDATSASANNRVAIGQIATNSVNEIRNTQSIADAAATTANADNNVIGVETAGGTTSFDGGSGLEVDVSSSDIDSSARAADAVNQILFTGIAGNTTANVNTVINDQDVDEDVTARATNNNLGVRAEGEGFNVSAADLTVTTLANSISSQTDASVATNVVNSLGSVVNSDTNVTNNQNAGATASTQVTSLTSSNTLGVSIVTDGAVAGNVEVDANSNSVTSQARINTATNSITVDEAGSSNNADNDLINNQATGNSTDVSSRVGRTDIGAFVDAATAGGFDVTTGNVDVEANSNVVSSSASVNTAVNTIDPAGIADSSNNSLVNNQDVVGDVSSVAGLSGATDTIINIGVSSTEADIVAGTFLVTASSNEVSSASNGNIAVNLISNETSSQNAVNNIDSDQSNLGTGAGTTALTNFVSIGGDVDTTGAAGNTLTVVANSNEVSASTSLNAVNNIIDLDTLATGTNNDITNAQTATIDNGGTGTVTSGSEVSSINIGVTTSDTDNTDVNVTSTTQSNTIASVATANSALNSITVDNLGNSVGNDIDSDQTLNSGGGDDTFQAIVNTADIGVTFSAGVTAAGDLVAQTAGNEVIAAATGNTAVNTISSTLFGGTGSTIDNNQSVDGVSILARVGTGGAGNAGVSIGINGGGATLGGVGDVTVSSGNNSINAAAIGNSAVNRLTGLSD